MLETKFRMEYWKLSFEQQALLAIDKTYARLYVVYRGPVRTPGRRLAFQGNLLCGCHEARWGFTSCRRVVSVVLART